MDIRALLDWIFELRYFHPEKDGEAPAMPSFYSPGNSRLVLVLGDNASGKSFFRRLVSAVTNKKNKDTTDHHVEEMIHLSMEGRAGTSMYGPAHAMVYGDESWGSTGQLTASTITTGIRTATGRKNSLIMYWDEPDIGMSVNCAAGTGIALRRFVTDAPAHIQAVFITTHSPALAERLCDGINPHYIYLGDESGPKNIGEWIDAQRCPVPVDPEALQELSLKRFRRIQTILNSKSKQRPQKE